MRPGTAKVKASDRSSMRCPTRDRAHEQKPVEGHRTVEDVAPGQAKDALEVPRCENFVVQHTVRESWSHLLDQAENTMDEGV